MKKLAFLIIALMMASTTFALPIYKNTQLLKRSHHKSILLNLMISPVNGWVHVLGTTKEKPAKKFSLQ